MAHDAIAFLRSLYSVYQSIAVIRKAPATEPSSVPAYTADERLLSSLSSPSIRGTVDRLKTDLSGLGDGLELITVSRDPNVLTSDLAAVRNEKVAICTIDGGLSEKDAERVAWREIDDFRIAPNGMSQKSITW